MKMSLDPAFLAGVRDGLRPLHEAFATQYPGDRPDRQPVHTVYGGAHLFRADSARKLGDVALEFMERYAPDPPTLAEAFGLDDSNLASTVHARVTDKLTRERVTRSRLKNLVQQLYDGAAGQLVLQLVRTERFTKEERHELQKLIDMLDAKSDGPKT